MRDPNEVWDAFRQDPPATVCSISIIFALIGLGAFVAAPSQLSFNFMLAGLITGFCCLAVSRLRRKACANAWRKSEGADGVYIHVEPHPVATGALAIGIGAVCFFLLFYPHVARLWATTPAGQPAEAAQITTNMGAEPASPLRPHEPIQKAPSREGAGPSTMREYLSGSTQGPVRIIRDIEGLVSPQDPPPLPPLPSPSTWVLVGDRIPAARHGSDFRPDASGDGPARFDSIEAVRAAVTSGARIDATGLQARQCATALPIERCRVARSVGGPHRMRQISIAGDGGVWVKVES